MGISNAELPVYRMTIAGQAVDAAKTMPVVNPANGEAFALAPDAGTEELDAAVAAAQAAYPAWRALPSAERRALIVKAAERIEQHAKELGALFTREQGRPFAYAKQEIYGAAYWLRAMAAIEIPVEIAEDSEARRIEVYHEPLGVVCAIVPWNFPVMLAAWKIGPALVAGNTMVLKPSPFTPLCMLRIAELLRDVLPPGVLNVICGGDALGPLMTAHAGFAKISFTGSTATGKRVMEAAARDLKRLTLELGGNDAAIVLPDVDVDAVAEALFFGAFYNSAQVCIATKRLYIHDSIYDAVRDRLHAIAQRARVGDGMDKETQFGPLQNAPQYRRVKQLIEETKAAGHVVLEGAAVPEQGYFLPLTLVDNPPDDARVVVEEAFGPVLPLLRYHSIDEVIARANASEYGLAGAVWSADIGQAIEVAKRLETGTVWINQNLQTTPQAPLAGHKHSGVGVENGLPGLLEFTQPKTLYIPKKAGYKLGF
ncbi:aldehyde dehydrogenase family protein [Solimonas soli]|uniref:aldehyde dehydrogenase family protein n=1 Tax=Solimonas soli TaxID=413479 RepID=UPI0004847C86|nr:aldehyde dehydrogenase family protein [Solimonas soli]